MLAPSGVSARAAVSEKISVQVITLFGLSRLTSMEGNQPNQNQHKGKKQ
jgi:hypothetical protein